MYYQDESRFGIFTRNGKFITAKGVKPICKFQQIFQSMYLFGAYSPITGDHFEFEFPECNGANFQTFLDQFSKENEEEFKIILLDNGPFHKAKTLIIPKNITLVFIPPYGSKLNPSEKVWWEMKCAFTGKLHKTLDEVSGFITNQVKSLTKDIVKNICGFEYVFYHLILQI